MRVHVSPTRAVRGAILVQVALALIALLAFGAFVIDYGVLWASRGQAQNAADGAALAGAVALSYDDPNDRTDTGPAKLNALSVALSHKVWGEAPSVTMADITFPPCPDDASNACVRVNVYRDALHGNPLPTFLARLVGVDWQGVKATATAKAGRGNAVDCLRPFAVADRWKENYPVELPLEQWSQTESTFDKYPAKKGDPPPSPVDVYRPPTESSMGTGLHPYELDGSQSTDYGMPLTLKLDEPTQNPDVLTRISSGWFMLMDYGSGGKDVRCSINGTCCHAGKIGDILPTEQGVKFGPTIKQGIGDLIDQDPLAEWDPLTKSVTHSEYAISPRIIPVVLFDPDEFLSHDPSGKSYVLVTNILGFFVAERESGKDKGVLGYLCALPGNFASGPSVIDPSSFVRTIQLVR